MLALLQSLLDHFVCWIQTGAVLAFNGIITALGALVTLVLAADPITMPAVPTLPSQMTGVLSWVAWVFPVNTAVQVLLFAIAAWIAWQGIAIALRWAKALGA